MLPMGPRAEKTASRRILGPGSSVSGIPLIDEVQVGIKIKGLPMIAIQYGEETGERFVRSGTRIQIDIILSDLMGCFLDDSSVLFDRQIAPRNCVTLDGVAPQSRVENEIWCRSWDL